MKKFKVTSELGSMILYAKNSIKAFKIFMLSFGENFPNKVNVSILK